MCTGFTFQAKNGDVILGRTMDYDYPLTGHPLCATTSLLLGISCRL